MANLKRGFSTMEDERKKEIASKGGRAAHSRGNAYKLTADDRRKGGSNSKGNFKHNPDRARELGKIGGSRRQARADS